MTYQKKLPPFRVTITKKDFNKLFNLIQEDNNELKEKLLKYTFIQDGEMAELRLFPYEAECVFLLLLKEVADQDELIDYYNQLIEKRKKYIEEKKEEGGDLNA